MKNPYSRGETPTVRTKPEIVASAMLLFKTVPPETPQQTSVYYMPNYFYVTLISLLFVLVFIVIYSFIMRKKDEFYRTIFRISSGVLIFITVVFLIILYLIRGPVSY